MNSGRGSASIARSLHAIRGRRSLLLLCGPIGDHRNEQAHLALDLRQNLAFPVIARAELRAVEPRVATEQGDRGVKPLDGGEILAAVADEDAAARALGRRGPPPSRRLRDDARSSAAAVSTVNSSAVPSNAEMLVSRPKRRRNWVSVLADAPFSPAM